VFAGYLGNDTTFGVLAQSDQYFKRPIMPNLNSSCIESADYNDGTLYVTFRGGRTYTLTGVPMERYIGLITSSSPGRYWSSYLKGKY
jgi:hypothetical protein